MSAVILLTHTLPEHDDFNDPARAMILEVTRQAPVEIPFDQALSRIDELNDAGIIVEMGAPTTEHEAYPDHMAEAIKEDERALMSVLKTPSMHICLGHQGVGVAAGARVLRSPDRTESEDGLRKIIPTAHAMDHWLFQGLGSGFDLECDHRVSITRPAGFTILASSYVEGEDGLEISCFNQIMQMDNENRLVICVQAHLERTQNGGQMFRNVYERAVAFNRLRAPAKFLQLTK